jgi:cyclopropane fatty-acyl-phospholipid synthase-like methyltransferase
MDRITWLREMRQHCEGEYDLRWAPFYGEKWGLYNNTTHLQFLDEFISLLPPKSMILDAACGAGRYLPFLLEKGHSILGIDQSQGMLANARAKFPAVPFEKIGLQEMAYREVFDGAICVDAMENVCPEDWPLVLDNFHEALKPNGCLYFTAETAENAGENEIKQAFERAQQAGLPVVYGEWPDEEVYHYHPTNQQVREWVQQAGFEILKAGNGEIYYYHILLRKHLGDQK